MLYRHIGSFVFVAGNALRGPGLTGKVCYSNQLYYMYVLRVAKSFPRSVYLYHKPSASECHTRYVSDLAPCFFIL